MDIKEILELIDGFNTNNQTDDYVLTDFFDKIGDKLSMLIELKKEEKQSLIKSLFCFLKRQSQDLEENWSLIHLLEDLGKPTYEFYNEELLANNKENCSITTLILLRRHINSLASNKREQEFDLLKLIIGKEEFSELVKEQVKEMYEDYLEDE